MHVVMSGYFGFDNIGDEAILFSIIRALRKIDPTIEITVLSNNPAETAATYGVAAVNRWSLGEARTALKKADGLISGGGSLMQDATGGKSIPYYSGIIKMAQMLRVPVFVYAQGMGPINGALGKWLVKTVFNKCAGITVRDEDSRQLLTDIGVRLPVTVVPDPVVGLGGNEFVSPWLESWLASTGKAVVAAGASTDATVDVDDSSSNEANDAATNSSEAVGADDDSLEPSTDTDVILNPVQYISVSVRDWPTEVDYKGKIAASLDLLAAQGLEIVFIPMHGEHDVKASNDVLALMKNAATIAPGDLSIEEKIAVIGGSKLLIGQRLHSLIFSAIENTPFIALSYDPKIDAFANIVEQPIIGHVEVDNWDGNMLAAKATEILADYDAEVSKLANLISPMQAAAENTAAKALNTFLK